MAILYIVENKRVQVFYDIQKKKWGYIEYFRSYGLLKEITQKYENFYIFLRLQQSGDISGVLGDIFTKITPVIVEIFLYT